MLLDDYQELAHKTAVYNYDDELVYSAMGLFSEAGEVANKVKKVLRGDEKYQNEEWVKGVLKGELGGVLWYLAEVATNLGLSLSDIARDNIDELQARKMKGNLKGDGDHRGRDELQQSS
jgi:NTP pyrophosphatase (non-canonical NTP hydrolase)